MSNLKNLPKQTTYAFIDSQNLNLGTKSQGWNLDFARFRVFLQDKYSVSKAFIFIGYIPTNESLYTQLQKDGYIVIFKPVLQIGNKSKTVNVKGNVDAELVLHSMIEYPNYGKAVIVSGDGDFHCLVEHLEQTSKLLKIIVPNQRYSSLLRKYADYIVNIAQFKAKLSK